MAKSRRPNCDETALPLAEEVATLAKRDVHTGSVHVRTTTDTIEDIVRSTLQNETIEVERVAVDREITAAPDVRIEGDVTVIPVLEEVLVVEKRLVLKEEIRVRRVARTEHVEVPVTLRRQRAVVEHLDAAGKPANQKVIKETP